MRNTVQSNEYANSRQYLMYLGMMQAVQQELRELAERLQQSVAATRRAREEITRRIT